jgi:hypothetical protein
VTCDPYCGPRLVTCNLDTSADTELRCARSGYSVMSAGSYVYIRCTDEIRQADFVFAIHKANQLDLTTLRVSQCRKVFAGTFGTMNLNAFMSLRYAASGLSLFFTWKAACSGSTLTARPQVARSASQASSASRGRTRLRTSRSRG